MGYLDTFVAKRSIGRILSDFKIQENDVLMERVVLFSRTSKGIGPQHVALTEMLLRQIEAAVTLGESASDCTTG